MNKFVKAAMDRVAAMSPEQRRASAQRSAEMQGYPPSIPYNPDSNPPKPVATQRDVSRGLATRHGKTIVT